MDPFALNVAGVEDLINNKTNKVSSTGGFSPEGAESEKYDSLDLPMDDADLLKLRDEYEKRYAPYESILTPRVKKITNSYLGRRADGQYLVDTELPIAANLQFQAMETFLAAALAKNPDPVVYCDNTPEGQAIADAVKTMLQFHADQLVLRRKFTLMVRQWGMKLLGVLKPGWDAKLNDVTIDNRKIQDYVFDPDGYVNAYGEFSSWFGERIRITAEKLMEEFPKHKEYIDLVTDGKMGTECVYTEWWPTDEYCFYTFKDKVLDKHKNQYFNYPEEMNGQVDPITGELAMSTPHNHFASPKKPGIFLSVFSLQEHPHDITSLVEQGIPNQNLISRETEQVDFNASTANNSFAFSEANFNQETAKQAANARRKGNPILIPEGGPISEAIVPLDAQPLPPGLLELIQVHKEDMLGLWGVQGITSQPPAGPKETATEIVAKQNHDSSRIGGGVGDAIEQVGDLTFNWLGQLYTVFYDEKHFAAIMGNSKAVEYVQLSSADMQRQLIISVSPDSMKPKDEISQMNMAETLFAQKAIGPKVLLKMLDFPDPDNSAADGVLYAVDPQGYLQMNWPELAQQMQQAQQQQMAVMNAQEQQQGAAQMQQEGAQAQQQMQTSGAQANQTLQQKEEAHKQKMIHGEEAFAQKQKQVAAATKK